MKFRTKKKQQIYRRKPPRRFKLPNLNFLRFNLRRGSDSRIGLYLKIFLVTILGVGIFIGYQNIKIQDYVVYGNSRVAIPANIDSLKGESLFSNIKSKFLDILDTDKDKIESVNVVKKIGGQVVIELIEKTPKIAYLSVEGIKLIDGNGRDVGDLNSQKFNDLPNYQFFTNVIVNIDDEKVVRRYLEVNKDVQGAKTWSDLSTDDRKAFIQQQKDFYTGLWNNYVNNQKEAFYSSNYKDLNIVVNRAPTADNSINVDPGFINYVISMKTFLLGYDVAVSEIRYRDILSFSFITANGKELIFRKNKLIQEQQKELETFLGKVGINNGNIFDFRGDIISVK